MFPYLEIGSLRIYMTGIGILLFLITFLFIAKKYAHKYKLPFDHFLKKFPLYLVITYITSTYVWYLVEEFVVFPLDREYILLYLSPYDYAFHYIGILLGFLISGIWFLRSIPTSHEKKRWVDVFCHAITTALIPLGIFLLLGDNFIGQTTNGSFFVSAIKEDSQVAAFDKVFPVGLLVSLWGVLGHIVLNFWEHRRRQGFGFLWLALLLIGLSIILTYQQYPRHFVSSRGSMVVDIKQYASLLLALVFFIKFLHNNPKST